MSIDNFIMSQAKCIRVFTFELIAGKEQDYNDYLTQVVETIDRDAHQKEVFREVLTLRPDEAEHGRRLQRVFLFTDQHQRQLFAERMAEAAMLFDGTPEAQQKRKAYVNTLRTHISVHDYTFC
ncbi:hypothetical protein JHU04_000620 [Brenneria sp. 4F2]|nr:hypothetical protein [Brenneria bubanii]